VSDEQPWNSKSRSDDLGSLAQSARKSNLSSARGILIAIGILNGLGAVFFYFNADREAAQVIEQEKKQAGPFVQFDPVKVKEAQDELARVARLIYLGVIATGVVFVGLGVAVKKAPVPCTVAGLVMFLGLNALAALADPVNLVRGFILKIIFFVGLIKAVQAAVAYERDRKAEAAARREREEAEEDAAADDRYPAEFPGFGDGPERR
jgi:predicted RND superfamily exporter protein